jgi:hypothetical protein
VTAALASAADAAYGYHLLNLIGSVRANSDVFERVVVHDLGLTAHQRELLGMVPRIEVRRVPPFAPHWAGGFSWKPWIWTHLDTDELLYLDAGTTVLRSLEPVLAEIRGRGYWLVSQGHHLRELVPSDYYELYGLDHGHDEQPYVAAGIIGFRRSGPFYEQVIVPTYDDCLAGRSLGFSQSDLHRNRGLAAEESPPIRDCATFRWDQTLLNIHLVKSFPQAVVHDELLYAGIRSPREHPQQVIWAHRARGDLRYLKRVPYTGPGRYRARLFGVRYQLRWWRKLHEKYFLRATYVLKWRKIRSSLARGRRVTP